MSEALAVQEHTPAVRSEMTVDDLVAQVQKIQAAMSAVMEEGVHYGVIPGTDKPTLFKPGAEKLCRLFMLDPQYQADEQWDGDHLTVSASCILYHIPSGNRVAGGLAMCSSKETKYAYRTLARTCPACGAEAIIKGKKEYGGGWLCWKKKEGCGAKFDEGDPAIESQEVGRTDNDALPDTWNTIKKMACKRALIAAVLNGTAASDIFTQDLDDRDESLSEPVGDSGVADGNDVAQPRTAAGSESDEARQIARNTVASALRHAKEHGSLPPGHDDWDAYLKWHIEGHYKLKGAAGWRDKLTVEQLNELAAHLLEQDIPL